MNNNIFSIFKKINISSIASTTSNTLNVIKKIIPIYKEIRPYATKEKKLIDIMPNKEEKKEESSYDNSITFFQ